MGSYPSTKKSKSGNTGGRSAQTGQYSPPVGENTRSPFFGESGSTREVAISIHENTEGEAATLSGLNIEGDLDVEGHHCFFLEIHVHGERFSALSKELSTPGAVLHISVRSDRFPNFYAEWSPSISEGRVIKFLDSKRDVDNADEIPESFWHTPEFQRELISNPDNPPVTISVSRPLQPQLHAPTMTRMNGARTEDVTAPTFQQVPAPVPNPIPALEEISKRLRRGAFWISLWLALILVFFLLNNTRLFM